MVYLEEAIKSYKSELLIVDSIQTICYFYIRDKQSLPSHVDKDLGDEETLAIKGYLGIKPTDDEIKIVVGRKPIKQIDYTTNIYKLLGIFLATGELVRERVEEKFRESHLKFRYLISKTLPWYIDVFIESLKSPDNHNSPYYEILTWIYLDRQLDNIDDFLLQLMAQDIDIIDLLILEDLHEKLVRRSLSTNFQNLSAREMVIQVLKEFGNAVKKITRNRRKDHPAFEINDEYDVQDLLYVILKPLFPTLLTEDPAPRVGVKYTLIDLIIREAGIIIEVKMIKKKDKNEKEFVEQLKIDIQSYYSYPFIDDLLIYVYDPENKTQDIQNFYMLNGKQEIQGNRFNVEVIVGN